MKGINYLTDENGNRTAVVIDLHTYGEELEDFLDGLEAESRQHEPHNDFDVVVQRILEQKTTHD